MGLLDKLLGRGKKAAGDMKSDDSMRHESAADDSAQHEAMAPEQPQQAAEAQTEHENT